ncbi:MAG: MgtC/SapB family protein, partial [Treponema sp.]|nr:MgtC/SapB family protein [Treponema sp.]
MNFFNLDFPFLAECSIKILLSIVSGFVLGLERKSRNQNVGTRTLILISVSSTLLSILSYFLADPSLCKINVDGDPTRIAAGVVSGIGFLGGGAIMHHGLNIKGLTSAAIIWADSALGLAIGAGLYLQSLIVLVASVLALLILERAEEKWFPAGKNKILHIVFENKDVDMGKIKEIIKKNGFIISDLNVS